MLKNIILQQKKEKERFLSKTYIKRDKLKDADELLKTNLIKVITGPRRAGKSVFSFLLLKNKKFAYLNFDDEGLLKVKNYDDLVKVMFEVYGDVNYILFDEIQNLENWSIFVNKLQRRGYNLVITGSNAKLLSKEFASVLTGRYVSINILPYSFKEFLRAKKIQLPKDYLEIGEVKGKILNYFDVYLKYGGFPEIANSLNTEVYLDTLFDAIIFKDIVKRYNVRFSSKLYDLAIYLTTNFSSEFSYTKLKNNLDFNSVHTVQKYLGYLEESYLYFVLNRHSFKLKEQIKSPKKIYLVDNGIVSAKAPLFSQNMGFLMENLVFVELIRRGYKLNKDLFYYKSKENKEIDFIVQGNTSRKQLIQVVYKMDSAEIEKREISPFIKTDQNLENAKLLIISWDIEKEEVIKGKKIHFIPLWKWLLSSDI